MAALPLRTVVAAEIARWFYHHMRAEATKNKEVLARLGFDGQTSGQANQAIMRRLLAEFPGIEESAEPPFNLIEEWARRNRFVFPYQEYVFDRYNRLFIERLLALRDHTEESEHRFRHATLENFGEFDYTQTRFSISFLIRVENNMREMLREIVQELPNIDLKEAWSVIFEQSKEYQEIVNEVFEKRLQDARDESDRLLHNILPASIAAELKKNSRVAPVLIESATVLFTDFKGFTQISENMPPDQLLAELDACFSRFDAVCATCGLEKIKTIGDSFMAAGGLPEPNHTHVIDVALAALEMREIMEELAAEREREGRPWWHVRIGFHTGPVVAGVIGQRKFSYDIWGDTVNTASRMESSGEPGRINTSAASAEMLRPFFVLTGRGSIAAKNKGELEMFFVEGLKPRFGSVRERTPEFEELYERIKNGARVVQKSST